MSRDALSIVSLFARICGLNRAYFGRILCGTADAGELAQVTIA